MCLLIWLQIFTIRNFLCQQPDDLLITLKHKLWETTYVLLESFIFWKKCGFFFQNNRWLQQLRDIRNWSVWIRNTVTYGESWPLVRFGVWKIPSKNDSVSGKIHPRSDDPWLDSPNPTQVQTITYRGKPTQKIKSFGRNKYESW